MEKTNNSNQAYGFISNVKVFKDEDRKTLIHYISDAAGIELPISAYKRLLGIIDQAAEPSAEESAQQSLHLGLIAQPSLYLTKDGYVVHRFLGIRISKHENYYKKILGIQFAKKAQTA